MEEYGKSALLAIVVLMASAVMVTSGFVVGPPTADDAGRSAVRVAIVPPPVTAPEPKAEVIVTMTVEAPPAAILLPPNVAGEGGAVTDLPYLVIEAPQLAVATPVASEPPRVSSPLPPGSTSLEVPYRQATKLAWALPPPADRVGSMETSLTLTPATVLPGPPSPATAMAPPAPVAPATTSTPRGPLAQVPAIGMPSPPPAPGTKPQAGNGTANRGTNGVEHGAKNGTANGAHIPSSGKGGAILPPWRRFAARSSVDDGRPMIVVVIDDLGLNRRRMARTIALPTPLTLAILPYGENLAGMARKARASGHELLVHLPMEPRSNGEDPGPNALMVDLGMAEIERRIEWNLARFDGYVGVNNHMGSRFTSQRPLLRPLMTRLKRRGLLFLDSLTTNASVAFDLARSHGVPAAVRDIFLDNEITTESIEAQLRRVERCAVRQGQCIAIGHPHAKTLEALERWLPTLRGKGFNLVPLTAIITRRMTG